MPLIPRTGLKKLNVTQKEIEMAEKFVQSMTTEWAPEKYRDKCRERLMAWIEKKAHSGERTKLEEPAEIEQPEAPAEAVDLIALLRKSMERTGNGKKKRHEATA